MTNRRFSGISWGANSAGASDPRMSRALRSSLTGAVFALGAACLTAGCGSRNKAGGPPTSTTPPGAPCQQVGCVEVVYDRSASGGEPRRGNQVDDKDVYWFEVATDATGGRPAKVLAAPKNGGGPVRELGAWTDYQSGNSLVLDETRLYWLHEGKLIAVQKDGSERRELEVPGIATLDPGPLADAGDAIVVGAHGCGTLVRVPKDGSAATTWPVSRRSPAGGTTGLDVDGPRYYCANGKAIHLLDSVNGQTKELVSIPGHAGAIRVVAGDVYWADSGANDLNDFALIMLAAGADQPVTVGRTYEMTGRLLHDASRGKLYWTTGLKSHGCYLGVFDLKTRESTMLGQDLNVWGSTSQDASHVYWAASSAIMRARK